MTRQDRRQDLTARLGWLARLALVVVLLPWGAFHGAGGGMPLAWGAGLTVGQIAALEAPQGDRTAMGAPKPAEPAQIMPAAKRCKTGLPGGRGCATDSLLTAAAARLGRAPDSGAGLAVEPAAMAPTLPASPPRRPPRAA
jgi:hypothetical protein